MAVIIKEERENNTYQRIDLDRCFINSRGLYVGTVVYKDKSEREKEKLRLPLVSSFLESAKAEFERINSSEISEEDRNSAYEEYLHDILYASEQIRNIVYKLHYFPEFLEENPGFQQPERLVLTEKQLASAERFGFDRSWYEDPVLIVREDFILIDNYKKQDFNLDEFYRIFKDNILNSEGNKIQFEDDL